MKKFFALLLTLLLAGCSGCSGARLVTKAPKWDTGGDPDAAYAQQLMRETVEVRHEFGFGIKTPDMPMPKFGVTGGSGTGVVVYKRAGSSLVVTAGHVCKPMESVRVPVSPAETVDAPVLTETFYIWTIEGVRLEAEPLDIDEENDLCTLKVAGDAGDVAQLVPTHPMQGVILTHVGSPNRILNYHKAYISDGRYMGVMSREGRHHAEMSSNAADNGSSGGGLFYKGRLFGVVSMVGTTFKSLVIFNGDEPLASIVQKGKTRIGR